MLNFSVPLYIQIIQGRTPIETAIAMMPFNLTVFFTAMLVVRLYKTLTPRQIGRLASPSARSRCSGSPSSCATTGAPSRCMIGLILFGIGQGALVTLVFNVLVTASPKELAGDVGSLRGTTNNLAAARRHGGVGRAAGRPAQRHHPRPAGRATRSCRPRCRRRSISTTSTSSATTGCRRLMERDHGDARSRSRRRCASTPKSRLRALKIGLLIMAGALAAGDLPGQPAARLQAGRDPGQSAAVRARGPAPNGTARRGLRVSAGPARQPSQ